MTEATLKIDAKAFKAQCQRVRDDWETELAEETTLAGKRDWYRCELKGRSHFWKAPAIDRSYEGHFSNLICAARPLLQFGASEAQCRYLARLWADAGERVESMGRLTKAEASAMIDYAKRAN